MMRNLMKKRVVDARRREAHRLFWDRRKYREIDFSVFASNVQGFHEACAKGQDVEAFLGQNVQFKAGLVGELEETGQAHYGLNLVNLWKGSWHLDGKAGQDDGKSEGFAPFFFYAPALEYWGKFEEREVEAVKLIKEAFDEQRKVTLRGRTAFCFVGNEPVYGLNPCGAWDCDRNIGASFADY